MSSESLESRFNQAFDSSRFSFVEVAGFQHNPRLSFLCGCAIGYKMALEDLQKRLQENLKPENNADSEENKTP